MNYPVSYILPAQLKDGTLIQLRLIHPIDGKLVQAFKDKLSPESIKDRFLGYIPSVTEKLVQRLTKIDYDQEMAIVAESIVGQQKEPIAVARIVGEAGKKEWAEFALIIVDDWQGKGLGAIMTDYMIRIAQDMQFEKLVALFYNHNLGMKNILEQRGFVFKANDFNTTCATLILNN
ncbi:MAG: GNAT family N-acetyltransferase [Bacteroidota bacterium]